MIQNPSSIKKEEKLEGGTVQLQWSMVPVKIAKKKGVRTKNMHHHSRCCWCKNDENQAALQQQGKDMVSTMYFGISV